MPRWHAFRGREKFTPCHTWRDPSLEFIDRPRNGNEVPPDPR